MSLWRNAKFWTKLKDTFALGGTSITAGLSIGNKINLFSTPDYSELISIGVTFIGILIGMWFEDKDGNNIPDIFEATVTTKVTSDSPITVTTSEEEKPKQ
jgi:hypothetical protein